MLVSWNWLTDYIGETELTAEEAADLLGQHAFELEGVDERADDTVMDIDVLPNRSSDCLCHRGIARELASITGVPLANDPLQASPAMATTDVIAASIADEEACPRFSASLLQGIMVGESPDWLKQRLQAIGQRPINNIVDATNYVMFALGQPIHAYDADLFPQHDGKWQFAVRYARPGEQVHLIPESGKSEDRVVECVGSELLIVDASNDRPIGLAGVKGGSFAGVHEGTQNVIVEAAHFDPIITRKTARRLGIVIDASKRFENEPSRDLIPYAQQAVTQLIATIAGGACAGMLDIYPNPATPTTVTVASKRVIALLGLSIPVSEMIIILNRIGATVSEEDGILTVTAPWERTDLNIEEDYIEEIGRLYGYDKVVAIPPQPTLLTEINARQYYSEKIRACLLTHGFSEVITSSFRKKDTVQLRNALASDKSYLRSSLYKNLTEVLDTNANFVDLLGTNDTCVFEIGTVFSKDESGIQEHVSLALGVRSKSAGYSGKEDAVLTEAQAAVAATLDVEVSWTTSKGIAETNLSELLQTLPKPTAYEAIEPAPEIQYQPFSTYPAVARDIAMWVSDKDTVAAVINELNTHAGELCRRITHIDTYTKDGRQSLAFRMVFQAMDRTLTDTEVNDVMDSVYSAVAAKNWEVR